MDTITDSGLGWMSSEEQAQVRANHGLEWVFREPDGLIELRGTCPPAPQPARMLATVYLRAARGETGPAPPWSGAAGRRAWAAWGSAAVLVILALLLLPRVIDLTPESAWAMVDGFILEYDMQFEEEYTHSAAVAPDHPLNALIISVHEWDTLHRDELGGDVSPRTSVDIRRVSPNVPEPYRAALRILVPGATEGVRDDLIQMLAALDGLSEPKVFSQRWYYQEKYPELFVEHRRLIIDGEECRFPEDFSNDEIESLLTYLNHCALGGGRMYVAYLTLGTRDRFGLGDVVSFDTNEDGEIEIATYADTLDFAPGEKPADKQSWWILIPPEEEQLDYDPVEILKRQVDPQWTGLFEQQFTAIGRMGTVLAVDLLPARRWLGLTPERMAHEFSTREQARARELFNKLEETAGRWAAQLPKDSDGKRPEYSVQAMESGGVMAQAWITIWVQAGKDFRSQISELEQQVAAISGTAPDSFSTREAVQVTSWSYPPRFLDYFKFHYDLLPADTADMFEDEIPSLWGDEEKRQARETAERMEAAFNEWVQYHPELLEEREVDSRWLDMMQRNNLDINQQHAYVSVFEHAGVIRKISVYLHKDDQALAAELQQVLALPGVPEPEVSKPGDSRNSPEMQEYFDNRTGYRIEWQMFDSYQKSRCVDMGRTPEAFTVEERDTARAVLGAIRDGWREWLAEHPKVATLEYKGLSVHHAQTQHMAGVPTSFWLQLGVEDEELLAGVLADLDVPGAPEPEVTNLREEWEERLRKNTSKDREGPRRDLIDLEPIDGYRVIYHFFPQVDTMYLTYEGALERYSDEELDQAYDLALQLADAFDAWAGQQVMLEDEAQFQVQVLSSQPGFWPSDSLTPDRKDQVVLGVHIELQRDNPDWYEDCKAALAVVPIEPAADSGRSRVVKVIRKDG